MRTPLNTRFAKAVLLFAMAFPVAFVSMTGCREGSGNDNAPPAGSSASPLAVTAQSATATAFQSASPNPLPSEDTLPPVASATASAAVSATPVKTAAKPKNNPPPKPKATEAVASAGAGLPGVPGDPMPTPGTSATAAASATPPTAGDPAAQAIAQKADALYLPKTNLTAKFKQEFYIKANAQKKNSSGTMKFQRPGKMSWTYDPPNGNRVVSDGKIITIYESDNQQYTQQPFDNSEYAGALGFLTGDGITKHFSFSFLENAKFEGGKVLVGLPSTPNPFYEKVLFYVDDSTNQIRRVVIMDVQGNRNRFDFESMTEEKIETSEFTWTPPAGATKIQK